MPIDFPELNEQGLDLQPPVNLGAELLKGIGLLAAYHFGSLAISAVSRGAGRMATKATAKYGGRIAASLARPGAFGGSMRGALASDVSALHGQARAATSIAEMTGARVTGIGSLLRDHPSVAPSVARYAERMGPYRKAIDAHRATYTNTDLKSRITAMRGYFDPKGFNQRVVGSTEKYLHRYLGASVGFWATDRALGIFTDIQEEPGPAWYNIPGQMWDYAKFTASFLPVDLAFSGLLNHGLPLLRAATQEGANKIFDIKMGGGAPFRSEAQAWMARHFGSQAVRNPMSVTGALQRAKAFIGAIGQGMRAVENRDPIFSLHKSSGAGFNIIDPDLMRKRASDAYHNFFKASKSAYRENVAHLHRQAREMSGSSWMPDVDRLADLNDWLNPDLTNPAHDRTKSIAWGGVAPFLERPRTGMIAQAMGLEPAFVKFSDIPDRFEHLKKALIDHDPKGIGKFYLGQNILTAKGSAAHRAIIDARGWKFGAISKTILEPLENLSVGFPFVGNKLRIGEIFISPVRSILDRFSSKYGTMPSVRKLKEDESYLTFGDNPLLRPQEGMDVFFMHGQLYRRTNKEITNILEGSPYMSGDIPHLEWVGFDKGRTSRLGKIGAQHLGLVPQKFRDIYEGAGHTWEGVKRFTMLGGYARGVFGDLIAFYKNAFSRRNPKAILGDSRRNRTGFFDNVDSLYQRVADDAPSVALALEDFEAIGRDVETAVYNTLLRPGVQKAFSAINPREMAAGATEPILNFRFGRSAAARGITLEEMMTLPDSDLVQAAHEMTNLASFTAGPWTQKVKAILSRHNIDPYDGLSRLARKYPRGMMLGYKSDLSEADELRRFLFHETLYKTVAKEGDMAWFDSVVGQLKEQQMIGDREEALLRFTVRSHKYRKSMEDIGPAMLPALSNKNRDIYENLFEWMSEQAPIFRDVGSLYTPFAMNPAENLLSEYQAIGTEHTPITMLAKHKSTSPFSIGRQIFPHFDNKDPLTTIGATPFLIMDRFASVGHYLGVAYDPLRVRNSRELAGYFGKLAVGAGAALWAWQGMDTFLDVNPLFSKSMFRDGLNVALADQYVKARTTLAGVYDFTGVTAASQYMEGLMPGSVASPLSGAIRGIVAPVIGARFGPKGLAVGTAISALTAGGPLAMFDEWDLTKSREDLQKEYRGEAKVPMRKGKFWEASSTPWQGGKISYFAPSWYHRLKSQYRYTPTQFGGKLESMLYRDIPLLGFNPFAIVASPYHFEKKHYLDRPYPETSPAFQEVPFIGPLLSSTVGRLIKPVVKMHSSEMNASYVGDLGWVSNDTPGIGPQYYNTSQKMQTMDDRRLALATQNIRGKPLSQQSVSQTLASTFHRALEEPGGLIGWESALAIGGAPWGDATVMAQAGQITSHTRQYWDMQIGGALGTTEFLRRFVPRPISERDYYNPLRNRFPGWLPGGPESTYHIDFKSGDPYSRIPMGELRLPGKGYEASHNINFTFPSRASGFGKSVDAQIRFFLGLDSPATRMAEEIMDRGTELHKAIQINLARQNLLVQAEAAVYDPWANISGHVDAIIQEGREKRVLEIKTTSTEKLSRLTTAQDEHASQLNFYMKALGLYKGSILYVSRENPSDMRIFEYKYNPKRYEKDLRRLEEARTSASLLRKQGVGDATEGYSWLDRAEILSDVAPYAPETQEAITRAQIQVSLGKFGPDAQTRLDEIVRQRHAVARQYDLYPRRFGSFGAIINPDEEYYPLAENLNIKAAAEYGPMARVAGAAWELLSHRDTWIHRKFLNTYSPVEHYERNVLYNRPTSFWDAPIRDFVEPTVRSLAAVDDPFEGGVSWALTAGTFGTPTFGAVAGVVGSVWGAIHGAYRSLTDSTWIPDIVQRDRDFSEYFDKLQYVKAMRMYNQTRDPHWMQVASETLTGVNPYNQTRQGWTRFFRAMPAQERAYTEAFLNAVNPDDRERIREIVPPNVRDALQAKWNQLDFDHSTEVTNTNATLESINYFRNHHLPKAGWIGWHPMANIDDIMVKTIEAGGANAHDFNLGWMQQRRRMAESGYLYQPIDIDNPTGEPLFPGATIGQFDIQQALQGVLKQLGVHGSISATLTHSGQQDAVIIVNIERAPSNVIQKAAGAAYTRT